MVVLSSELAPTDLRSASQNLRPARRTMDRRTFLALSSNLALGSLAVQAMPRSNSQQLVPVRLLVLRRLGLAPTTQCKAPCIRGRLFDVTAVASGAINET